MSGLLGACVCVKYLPDLSAPMSQSQHRLQELLAQGENTESRQRVEESMYYIWTAFPVIFNGVSSTAIWGVQVLLWWCHLAQSGRREPAQNIQVKTPFGSSVCGFFRNHPCISGERLCNARIKACLPRGTRHWLLTKGLPSTVPSFAEPCDITRLVIPPCSFQYPDRRSSANYW